MYVPALLLKARVQGDLGESKEMKNTLDLAVLAGAPAQDVAVERARLLMASGDRDGALRLLRAAVASRRDPSTSIALATAEAGRGELRLALAALDACAEAHPAAIEIDVARAFILLRFSRHEEALALFRSLKSKAPESPALTAGLADTLALAGRLKEAAEHYEAAVRLPGAPPSIWVNAGAVYNALGDFESARRWYQEALARDGSNPHALNNLAYLLGRSGKNLEFALQLAQNAESVLPHSEEVQDTLLYVTLRMGLKQQALEILDRAAARSRTESKDWFRSLRAELAGGSTEQVLRRLEVAQRGRRLS
jgi:Flp pilus assembly protein TadD